jgi:hypothetical protein
VRQNDEKDIGTKEVGRERRARNGRAGKSAGKRDSVRAGGMSRRGKGTVPWGRVGVRAVEEAEVGREEEMQGATMRRWKLWGMEALGGVPGRDPQRGRK